MGDLEKIGKKHFSNKPPYYLNIYEDHFRHLRDAPISILELGVHRGGSLDTWAEYFPHARIAGLDLKQPVMCDLQGKALYHDGEAVDKVFGDRISFFKGSQVDVELLDRITRDVAPGGWDIVLDDCSHVGSLTQDSFLALFPRVKPDRYYVVEDWATGYWPEQFPDAERFRPERHFSREGKNFPVHQAGITGFVKQFVDEVALDDAKRVGDSPRSTAFRSVCYYKGVVVIRKLGQVDDLRLVKV